MKIDLSQLYQAEDQAKHALSCRRANALERLRGRLDQITASMIGPVPLAEQLSWGGKETAAQAVLDGTANTSDIQLLMIEAREVGEPLQELARKIQGKAAFHRQTVPLLAGMRRTYTKRISSAATDADIQKALSDLETDLKRLSRAA